MEEIKNRIKKSSYNLLTLDEIKKELKIKISDKKLILLLGELQIKRNGNFLEYYCKIH